MNELKLYEKVSPTEKNFPVKFSYPKGTKSTRLHWHEYIELLYFKTDGSFLCDGKIYKAKKRTLAVINPKESHQTYGGNFYCVRIAPSFFEDVSFENIYIQPVISYDDVIEDCFEKIYFEYTTAQDGYDMEVKSLAYRLMCHLLRNYKLTEEKKKTESGLVGEILTYIGRNCHNKLSTSSVADYFHLSENYFCYFFKKNTGLSLIDYVNKFRIEKSVVLLKNTDKSITDICYTLGFNDSNYFSRVFRKYKGISPREYRKQNKKLL